MSSLSNGLTRVVGQALLHFSVNKIDTAYPRYAREFCGSGMFCRCKLRAVRMLKEYYKI